MFKQMGRNFHLLFYYFVNIKVAYGVFDIVADFCILSIAIKFTINRKIAIILGKAIAEPFSVCTN